MADEEPAEAAPVEAPPTVASPVILEACMKNAGGKIKVFYEKNEEDLAKINEWTSAERGWTPLQVAAGYGADSCVKVLIECGAKADIPDKMGMTAVHSGADCDEKSVMSLLLDTESGKGAINAQDADGCTPLHYAAYANREAIVITLLRAGAATDVADGAGKTALQVATEYKLNNIVALITNGPPPEEAPAEAAAE